MSANILVCFELFVHMSSYKSTTVASENTLPAFTWFVFLKTFHCMCCSNSQCCFIWLYKYLETADILQDTWELVRVLSSLIWNFWWKLSIFQPMTKTE